MSRCGSVAREDLNLPLVPVQLQAHLTFNLAPLKNGTLVFSATRPRAICHFPHNFMFSEKHVCLLKKKKILILLTKCAYYRPIRCLALSNADLMVSPSGNDSGGHSYFRSLLSRLQFQTKSIYHLAKWVQCTCTKSLRSVVTSSVFTRDDFISINVR